MNINDKLSLSWRYWVKMFFLVLAVQVVYELLTNSIFKHLFQFWEDHRNF